MKEIESAADITKFDLENGLKEINRINENVGLFEGRIQSL